MILNIFILTTDVHRWFCQNKVSTAYLQKNCVMCAEHFEVNRNETHFVLFLLLLLTTKFRKLFHQEFTMHCFCQTHPYNWDLEITVWLLSS